MGELYLHDLQKYINKYGCDVFIESGTGKGTGLSHALKYPFSALHSFEYVGQLYEYCVSKFTDDRLKLHHTDTVSGLYNVLPSIDEDVSVLFWLDAHFPGADFHFNDYDHLSDNPTLHMPLEDEIDVICELRPNSRDVIIIDDLQIYVGDEGVELPNPPGFNEKYGMTGIDFIENAFLTTHNFTRDNRHQGFLILTPKEENVNE